MGYMKTLVAVFSLISLAFGADDPWTKVKDLSSGAEVRILKSGAKEPITGNFSEADDERIIVVVKNTQMALDKSAIERLEARPMAAKRTRTESRTQKLDPSAELAKPKVPVPGSRPTPDLQSTSSGVTFTGKPAFELIYRKGMK